MTNRVETTITNLIHRGFDARYCETIEEANELIGTFVQPSAEVGFGGSMTLADMQTAQYLQAKGCVILDHNLSGLSAGDKAAIRKKELVCDVFLTSSNALTEAGQLFNVDGVGNRVAAMTYGPDKVIVVVGINKIVADIPAAHERVHKVAAPKNNVRLQTDNPCTTVGYCVDCYCAGRICNVVSIMERKPMLTDMTVIVVNETLGF